MSHSRTATGVLLIVFGVGCSLTALSAGPEKVSLGPRSPFVLLIWGGLLILMGVYRIAVQTPGLTETIQFLHPLAGKHESMIREWLGAPHSMKTAESGENLLTWVSADEAVTLAFRDGICQGLARKTKPNSVDDKPASRHDAGLVEPH